MSAPIRPIVINVPYGDYSHDDFERALLDAEKSQQSGESELNRALLRFVIHYPTVYVVYSGSTNRHSKRREYTVYVGETNDIVHRTMQHLYIDPKTRDDWKAVADAVAVNHDAFRQYVISHPYFNKSLTLDVENRLMHYMSSSDSVKHLNNRRTNAQGDYYTSDQFDRIFSEIWLELHREDPQLFPAEEIIRDSALFKASPFHKLSDNQLDAEETILAQLAGLFGDTESDDGTGRNVQFKPRLIFVEGAAGTGKTVLLSHLFYRIATELGAQGSLSGDDDASSLPEMRHRSLTSYILVNHKEQVHVYNQIAAKLGLQKQENKVVMLPSQFINRYSVTTARGRGIPDKPRGRADIVLIDEAHLLATQGTQGYSGKNQLYDILRRARVVIAVFDTNQILQARQQWHSEVLDRLLGSDPSVKVKAGHMDAFRTIALGAEEGLPSLDCSVAHIRLKRQFRIAASEEVIHWLDEFASHGRLSRLPIDEGERDDAGNVIRAPYEVKVFDSPVELYEAMQRKAALDSDGWNGVGLSRLLATYDWKYSSQSKNEDDHHGFWNVALHRDASGRWLMNTADGDMQGYTGHQTPDRFCLPWNYQLDDPDSRKIAHDLAWAEKPYTINEVGSTFTIQGFDLNFAGVIIGPSVQYRDGRIVFDPTKSTNHLATNKRKDFGDSSRDNLRNELNVLLKRGVHGLYLFAVDPQLQQRLKECCA